LWPHAATATCSATAKGNKKIPRLRTCRSGATFLVRSVANSGSANRTTRKINWESNLPAWFARLPRGFPVIFIREPVPSAAAFAAAPAIATAVPAATAIPATAAGTTLSASAAISREPAGTRSARRTAFALRTRFIHFQVAAAGFFAIQTRYSLRRFRVVGHFHECKSACSSSFAVHRHMHARHLAKRLEQSSKIALRRLKIHVSHKETFHVASPGF
jgi:hypothetical protein